MENLKVYLNMWLMFKRIHRVIKRKQPWWLLPFIDLNLNLAQKLKMILKTDLYKLMTNAIFGKTMENVEKHMGYEVVVNNKEQ